MVFEIAFGCTQPTSFTKPNVVHISFPKEKLTATTLLSTLGKLYEEGYNFKTEKLYPKVEFPVSRGTSMISPIIKWNHSEDWYTAFYCICENAKSGHHFANLSKRNVEWNFISGHVVDGRNLFPGTGYITLVWEALSTMCGMMLSDMKVVLENVKFLRATTVSEESNYFHVMIQRDGGKFEVKSAGREEPRKSILKLSDC